MDSCSKFFIISFLACLLCGCGGGDSSSGGGVADTPAPEPESTPQPTTMPGEFAVDCLANVQVRRNGTALVQNICSYSINVRQTNSRFPQPSPVTEIPPGQLVAVALGDDSTTVGFGACRSPSIPESSSPGFFTCTDVPVQTKSATNAAPQSQSFREFREVIFSQ